MTVIDRFYPIVGDVGWLSRLVPLGVRTIQLRIKTGTVAVILSQITFAQDLCRRHGAQLIVNDHWQLAIEAHCDFVHLGQSDLDTADLPAIRRAGIKLGLSTHDDAELERARSHAPDYIALGPVYPTVLKVMPWAPQGLNRLREWKRRIGTVPLVAIGGLTVERAAGIFAAGADSAAVLTDIVTSADPEARVRQWVDAARAPA
jgi:thiamine-phosphate pyrophosphorylase